MAPVENEPFQMLSDDEVVDLIESLHKNLPRSYHALCFAMNMKGWKKKKYPYLDIGIYSPQGDFSHCTFLLLLKFNHNAFGTYYSSSDEGCSRLKDALHKSHLISDGMIDSLVITSIHDRVHNLVGTDWCSMHVDEITPCNLFSMSLEEADKLNVKCPEDVEVRCLREEDAELIDSVWPHRSEDSVNFIKLNIKLETSVGLYRKSDGKLMSWVLKWFYGGIGVLQTVKEAKRKGYAQIVLSALVKQLVQEKWPIHATVLVGNHESTPLFRKMGFKQEFVTHYIDYIAAPSNHSQ